MKEEKKTKIRVTWGPTTSVQILSLLMFSPPSSIHSDVLFSWFSHYCDSKSNRKQLKEEGFIANGLRGQPLAMGKVQQQRMRKPGKTNAGAQLAFSCFLIFIQSRTPTYELEPLTLLVDLPSSFQPLWPSQTHPEVCLLGDSKFSQVDSKQCQTYPPWLVSTYVTM